MQIAYLVERCLYIIRLIMQEPKEGHWESFRKETAPISGE